jgi:hypothetical protein
MSITGAGPRPNRIAAPHGATRLAVTLAVLLTLLAGSVSRASTARATGSARARPASGSERAAIVAAFTASDGNASQVHGVFVSRSNPSLAVVCARTPEAGARSYVFGHSRHAWRYVTGGPVGRTGSSSERALERACR